MMLKSTPRTALVLRQAWRVSSVASVLVVGIAIAADAAFLPAAKALLPGQPSGAIVPAAKEYTPPSNSGTSNSEHIPGAIRAYQPPPNSQPSEGDHTGGGVRGCGGEMAALAPRLNFIGQTVSTRPTFIWYTFSSGTEPLEFHLYQYQPDGSVEALFIEPIGPNREGYMAYTLPADQPDLVAGETYIWQVVLYCDQNLEEVGQWTSADVEIVEPSADLVASTATDALQRAEAYAAAGMWYDALAAVYNAETPDAVSFRQALLLDLADLETEPGKEEGSLSNQLRRIAEMP